VKLQIPPLRFAWVEMTKGRAVLPARVVAEQDSFLFLPDRSSPRKQTAKFVQQLLSLEAPLSPLSSRPERTRISYFALLATTTCAALLKESRMQIINATGLHRKSGGA
jgi:hypothetical protein